MSKLRALFRLFRFGYEVTQVHRVKAWQQMGTVLIPLVAALVSSLQAWGMDLNVTDAQIAAVAMGLAAVYNLVLTAVSSKRASLPFLRSRSEGTDEHGVF